MNPERLEALVQAMFARAEDNAIVGEGVPVGRGATLTRRGTESQPMPPAADPFWCAIQRTLNQELR